VKRGTPSHPKTLDLAERLKVTQAHAVGILEMLWHFTAQYCPEGDIGRFSDKRIAVGAGWHRSPSTLVEALVASRWVDEIPAARLRIHDWLEHADRTTLQRLERNGLLPTDPQPTSTRHGTDLKVTSTRHGSHPQPTPNRPRPDHGVASTSPSIYQTGDLLESTSSKQTVSISAEVKGVVKTLPLPEPLPEPEPPPSQAPRMAEWPQASIEIRQHFPAANDQEVLAVVQQCVQECLSIGEESPDDDDIAQAVKLSHFNGQENVRAYRKRAAQVIKTWIERKKYREQTQRNGNH
jgi:hypothetical protein